MNIILEGPDGSGKSTLAKRYWPDQIIHFGPPPKGVTPFQQYAQALHDHPHGRVYDRFLYGERVYGPILRGADQLGAAGQRMLERVLLSCMSVLVYCDPGLETVMENWDRNKQHELVQDATEMEAIYCLYKDVVSSSELPTVTYDYHDTRQNVVDQIMAASISAVNHGPGVGTWSPGRSILIVGDTLNARAGYWPFVAETGSSPWLTEQLHHELVRERDLYWVNAWSEHDEPLRPDFLRDLCPRRIVALGHAAEQWCVMSGVRHYHRVDHPAYHKRFKHDDFYPLMDLLR